MIKSLAVAGAVGVLSAFTLVAPADAATSTVAVQVKQRPAKIHGNGTVTAVFWLRCKSGFNAFEYSVGVRQGETFGGVSGGPAANLLPCDGTRHQVKVNVGPESGAWKRGWADVDVNVQIYDPGNDTDIDAGAGARVWLKR